MRVVRFCNLQELDKLNGKKVSDQSANDFTSERCDELLFMIRAHVIKYFNFLCVWCK